MKKIVIGKPVTQAAATNTGLVSSIDLGNWFYRAYVEYGWDTGVMYWQYKHD